jgi:hypothetical protein
VTVQTPIDEDWLAAMDFSWRKGLRQPNKHWSLILNLTDESWSTVIEPTRIEVQRCGWLNDKGNYIGDPGRWKLWITDRFERTCFVRDFRWQEEISALAALLMGREWKPENHIYGQAWPDGSRALEDRPNRKVKQS